MEKRETRARYLRMHGANGHAIETNVGKEHGQGSEIAVRLNKRLVIANSITVHTWAAANDDHPQTFWSDGAEICIG